MSEDNPPINAEKTTSNTDDAASVVDESAKETSAEQGDDDPATTTEQDDIPRTTVRYKYSRDELLALKCHPLSILRPECFDPAKCKKQAALSVMKDFGGGGGANSGGQGGGSRGWEPGERERWGPEKRGKP
ncbi:hypothetical protein B566_EDAN015281, partial [Ephemera danica]